MEKAAAYSAPSCPGLSRASTPVFNRVQRDVDGRDEPGHDGRCNSQYVLTAAAAAYLLLPTSALAHVGAGPTVSLVAGVEHPLSGLDHIAVMAAVGLWAALKGQRALWVWPATFVAVMLIGGALGMAHVTVPFVEPAILASVVALGLLVALAIDLPIWLGAFVIGVFALFHGHAHGGEVAGNIGGAEYMTGLALATASLHAAGITFALATRRPTLIQAAGAACVLVGAGLYAGVL